MQSRLCCSGIFIWVLSCGKNFKKINTHIHKNGKWRNPWSKVLELTGSIQLSWSLLWDVPFLFSFFLVLVQAFPVGTALQTSLFTYRICSLTTPVDAHSLLASSLFPSSLSKPFPGLGFLLSSLFACSYSYSCLFPSLDLASRIPTPARGPTGRDQFLQFPRWPPDGIMRPSYIYLLGGWHVGS